jgi:hypothetical protein
MVSSALGRAQLKWRYFLGAHLDLCPGSPEGRMGLTGPSRLPKESPRLLVITGPPFQQTPCLCGICSFRPPLLPGTFNLQEDLRTAH